MHRNSCVKYSRFLDHGSCYDIFDEIKMPRCPAPTIHPVNLCASSLTGDICQGDSGGALVALDKIKRNYVLNGIVSFNLGCNSRTNDGKMAF